MCGSRQATPPPLHETLHQIDSLCKSDAKNNSVVHSASARHRYACRIGHPRALPSRQFPDDASVPTIINGPAPTFRMEQPPEHVSLDLKVTLGIDGEDRKSDQIGESFCLTAAAALSFVQVAIHC